MLWHPPVGATIRSPWASSCSPLLAVERLELVAQDAHDDGVPVAAFAVAVLAQPAFDLEAALLVAGDGAIVELERVEPDTVQVHLVEGEAEQRDDGVRAVAVRPVLLVVDP